MPNYILIPEWCVLTPKASAPRVVAVQDTIVAVSGTTIVYVGARERACEVIPRCNDYETIRLPGQILMPGFINAHCHAAMSLFRGIADDVPLDEWLHKHIFPREAAQMSETFSYDGARLAADEMLRGGITTVADQYLFPEGGVRGLREVGLRVLCGLGVIDFPTPYGANAQADIERGIRFRDTCGADALIRFAFAPHAPYTNSDATFEKIRTVANELDLPIHTHLQETAKEVTDSKLQYGITPTQRLAKLELLGPDFVAYHGVHLDATDRVLLAKAGASVVHCPSSNMKLASGIAPIAEICAAGINAALGTDGAASNNRLDMFQEMRHAALLAKIATQNAAAIPAAQVIYMATMGGAKALGWSDEIGSIEVGKQADFIAVDLTKPAQLPLYDPLSHLVYACDRSNVNQAWVAGEHVLVDRKPIHTDEAELTRIAHRWQGLLQ